MPAASTLASPLQIPEDCEGPHCIHGKEKGACSQTVGHWLFWLMLFVIVVTAIWSAMYLNRAMMVFGNTQVARRDRAEIRAGSEPPFRRYSQVVPVYYVTFTLFSIVGGAIVYKELAAITYAQMGMFGGGCICAALGVWLVSSGHTPGDDVRDSKGTEKVRVNRTRGMSPSSATQARMMRARMAGAVGSLVALACAVVGFGQEVRGEDH